MTSPARELCRESGTSVVARLWCVVVADQPGGRTWGGTGAGWGGAPFRSPCSSRNCAMIVPYQYRTSTRPPQPCHYGTVRYRTVGYRAPSSSHPREAGD